MRTLAAIFYGLGAVAGVIGIGLAVSEFRRSSAQFREWVTANPENHEGGSFAQIGLVNKVVTGLIGNRTRRVAAVVLLVFSVLTGTAGNFLSLYQ